MRAMALEEPWQSLKCLEVPVAQTGPEAVLIRVLSCLTRRQGPIHSIRLSIANL
jgi:hypothetical protein